MSEGSNSAAEICEICENENVKCLCDVKLTHEVEGGSYTCSHKLYHWKGTNEIFDPKDLKYFIGLKEVKINYVIKGCCEHNNNQCSKLFHYQPSRGPLGKEKFKWEQSKNTSLTFKYNKELLTAFGSLSTSSTQGQMQVYVLTDDGTDVRLNKGMQLENLERAFNFIANSRLSSIPVTVYNIGVAECVSGKLSSSEPDKGKANFRVVVVPNYKTSGELSINFGGAAQGNWSGQNYTTQKPTLGFQVTTEFKEFLNQEELSNSKLNITELSKLPIINSFGPFYVFTLLDKFLSQFSVNLGLDVGPFSFDLIPPNVKFGGTAELVGEINSNLPLTIKRTDVKLSLAPLVGFKITVDVIDALLTICPPARFYYAYVKQRATKLGKLRFAKKGGDNALSASDFKKLLDNEKEKLEEEKSNWNPLNWFSAEMLIWADLSASLELGADLKFEDTEINEFPEIDEQQLKGIAQLIADMGIQVKAKVLIFEATIAAGVEMKASWEFMLLRMYTKEDGDPAGSTKSGSSPETEWVVEYSGLRVRWHAEFTISIAGKGGNYYEKKAPAVSETTEMAKRDEVLRKYGFTKKDKNGNLLTDEIFYKQPEDLSEDDFKGFWLEVGYASTGTSSYEAYHQQKAFLEKQRELRNNFREYDKGEQVFSRKRIIYPEHRVTKIHG